MKSYPFLAMKFEQTQNFHVIQLSIRHQFKKINTHSVSTYPSLSGRYCREYTSEFCGRAKAVVVGDLTQW